MSKVEEAIAAMSKLFDDLILHRPMNDAEITKANKAILEFNATCSQITGDKTPVLECLSELPTNTRKQK